MNIDFTKVLDLIQRLVQPAKGTKFLVTLMTEYLIYDLGIKFEAPEFAIPTMGLVALSYFWTDFKHKGRPVSAEKEGES